MTGDYEALHIGRVKWYDPARGYGFILDNAGGPDILLHANTLRDVGCGTIVEHAVVTFRALKTTRGAQVYRILAIEPPAVPISDRSEFDDLAWQPARVKWFDHLKGFGFANVFGHHEDVFLHVDVLRLAGIPEVKVGEAVSVRVVAGPRGLLVAEVSGWETTKPRAYDMPTPSAIAELDDDEFRCDHADEKIQQSKRR